MEAARWVFMHTATHGSSSERPGCAGHVASRRPALGGRVQSAPQPRAPSASPMPSRWGATARLPRGCQGLTRQHIQVKHLPSADPVPGSDGYERGSGLPLRNSWIFARQGDEASGKPERKVLEGPRNPSTVSGDFHVDL